VEISQHIKDLLLTHDRVILSDFGAFIAKYKPAKINEETNTMSPPTKEIVFDPKIVKDSGLIEKHMAEKEKISLDEAQAQIDEYVKTVKSKLNAGKKVKFPELGSFTKIKEGIIMFTYEPSGNLLLDSYGLPKISLPKANKTSEKSTKPVKTAAVKSTSTTSTSTGTKTVNKTGLIIGAAALLLIIMIVSVWLLKPEWMLAGKNKTIAFYHSIFKSDKNDKSDKIAEITPESDTLKNKVIDKDDINAETEIKKDTSKVVSKEEITPPVNNKNKNTSTADENYLTPQKGKSYIIVASLPSPETAEKEKERFSQLGIKVQIIPSDNNKYRLTLGVYNSTKEAVEAYETFHASHKNIHPWLWEN
jgi:nucleoid DNA-binding protein